MAQVIPVIVLLVVVGFICWILYATTQNTREYIHESRPKCLSKAELTEEWAKVLAEQKMADGDLKSPEEKVAEKEEEEQEEEEENDYEYYDRMTHELYEDEDEDEEDEEWE